MARWQKVHRYFKNKKKLKYIFEGDYIEDKKEGFGEFYWQDGKIYKGNWKDGK